MKYIMLETALGQKLPIIFPTTFNHVDIAAVTKVLLERRQEVSSECVSAGFVELGDNVTVHGESESLGGLKSRPTDAMRIMIGEAVSHTPDDLMEKILAAVQEAVK